MASFKILEVYEKHDGISASRVHNLVATVEAESADAAPGVFAVQCGFAASAAMRSFSPHFLIGSARYEVNPD